jgi:hypothetical protein
MTDKFDHRAKIMQGWNASFLWSFDDDWFVRGSYGSPNLRQMPTMDIFKAARDKETGDIIISRCLDHLTPWNKGCSEKLIELFANEEKKRMSNDRRMY